MVLQTKPPKRGLNNIPDEILLQILKHLEPISITRLQQLSTQIRRVCLDNNLWKRLVFEESPWKLTLQARRAFATSHIDTSGVESYGNDSLLGDANDQRDHYELPLTSPEPSQADIAAERQREKARVLANWDPTFPNERVSWYEEYRQRNGPATVNWFQTALMHGGGVETEIETRGLALYCPYDGNDGKGTLMAVSPLDDGSVCLWDVQGRNETMQGAIHQRSKPNVLFYNGPGFKGAPRSKKINPGITESVAVDNFNHRAYFAVQGHLVEVDLHRLDVVSRESFEWSITTMSTIDPGVPLTVGTSHGIHLHDFRARAMARRDGPERLDSSSFDDIDLKGIFDGRPLPPYAPLAQPTPLSILHLPQPWRDNTVTNDIYVSGRFSSILHYDRRTFPSIVNTFHSGAILNSLAALPYSFSSVDTEVRRHAGLTQDQVSESKEKEGQTIIGGGTYKSKGSLELYGLSSYDGVVTRNSAMLNRQSAASAGIMSVTNHGTKIVFSDGAGLIKWFERDGQMDSRRLRIGHRDAGNKHSLFASMPGSDDFARKIISTKSASGQDRPNTDNIVFWAGSQLGMVSFASSPLFEGPESKETDMDPSKLKKRQQTRLYEDRMFSALEHQADEVRMMQGLGLGP